MGFTAVNSARGQTANQAQSSNPLADSPQARTQKSTQLCSRIASPVSVASTGQITNPYVYPQQRSRANPPLDFSIVSRWSPSSRSPPTPRKHISDVPEVPTVYPTDAEFADPARYISSLQNLGDLYGIVKVIPPRQWDPVFALDTELFWFKTKRQVFNQLDDGLSIQMSFDKALIRYHDIHMGPNSFRLPLVDKRPLNMYHLHRSVQLRGGFSEVCRRKLWAQIGRELGYTGKIMTSLSTSLRISYQKIIYPFDEYIKSNGIDLAASPRVVRFDIVEPGTPPQEGQVVLPDGITVTMNCNPSMPDAIPHPLVTNAGTTYRRPGTLQEPDWFRGVCDPSKDPPRHASYNLRQFQQKASTFASTYFKNTASPEEIETEYWRILSNPQECLEIEYGENLISSSGFYRDPRGDNENSINPWDFNRLPFTRGSFLRYIDTNVDNMALTHLEVGMLFATSTWATEDFAAHKISIQHFGDPRTWYCVPPEHYSKMLELVALEHNPFMITPQTLEQHGIPTYCVDQNPGEIVLVFPKTFTCHFSHGFNLNESVNLLLDNTWLKQGYESTQLYASRRIDPPFSYDKLLVHIYSRASECKMLERADEMFAIVAEQEANMLETFSKLPRKIVEESMTDSVQCEDTLAHRYLSWIELDGHIVDPSRFIPEQDSTAVFVTRYPETAASYFANLKNVSTHLSKGAGQVVFDLLQYLLTNHRPKLEELCVHRDKLKQLNAPATMNILATVQKLIRAVETWQKDAAPILKASAGDKQGRPGPAVLEALLDHSLDFEAWSTLIDSLTVIRDDYKRYSESMAHTLSDYPTSFPELNSILDYLLKSGESLGVQTPEEAGLKQTVETLRWVYATLEARRVKRLNLEEHYLLVQDAAQAGLPPTSLFVKALKEKVVAGEQLMARIEGLLMAGPDRIEPNDLKGLVDSLRIVPVRHDTFSRLHVLTVILDIKDQMKSENILQRPRYSFARQNGLLSHVVGNAVIQCEGWLRSFGQDPTIILHLLQTIEYNQVPFQVPPGFQVSLDQLQMLGHQLNNLQVVPDNIELINDLFIKLNGLLANNKREQLRQVGFY